MACCQPGLVVPGVVVVVVVGFVGFVGVVGFVGFVGVVGSSVSFSQPFYRVVACVCSCTSVLFLSLELSC